jgi:hypothetical protein
MARTSAVIRTGRELFSEAIGDCQFPDRPLARLDLALQFGDFLGQRRLIAPFARQSRLAAGGELVPPALQRLFTYVVASCNLRRRLLIAQQCQYHLNPLVGGRFALLSHALLLDE